MESKPVAHDPMVLPPLRLHHFFGATAVAAVVLAGVKLMIGDETFLELWLNGPTATLLVGQSIAAAGLCLGLAWRRKGFQFPSEPGHGLLVAHTVTVACCLALMALIALQLSLQPGDSILTRNAPTVLGIVAEWWQIALNGALLVVYIWCFRRLADDRRWRVFFLCAIANVSLIVGLDAAIKPMSDWLAPQPGAAAVISTIQLVLYYANPVLMYAVLAAVSFQDWRTGTPRHWTHWLGVHVMLVIGSVTLVHAIVQWAAS